MNVDLLGRSQKLLCVQNFFPSGSTTGGTLYPALSVTPGKQNPDSQQRCSARQNCCRSSLRHIDLPRVTAIHALVYTVYVIPGTWSTVQNVGMDGINNHFSGEAAQDQVPGYPWSEER